MWSVLGFDMDCRLISGFIYRFRSVRGSWFVRRLGFVHRPVRGIRRRPLVSDGGVVAGFVGVVRDDHSPAVGEIDEVLPLGAVPVAFLRVAEVRAVVVISDAVAEVVSYWL